MSDYVLNILNVYLAGTEDEINQGITWYSEANSLASEIANGNVWMGAGVIAAYSPMTPWSRNKELAIDSFLNGTARTDSLGHSVRCAQRIMDGEHPLDVLKGDKVRAFCSAIADPDNSMIATIDRHAFDIAHNKSHTDATRRIGKVMFRTLSDAYVEASDLAGISVCQIQAATWTIWRNRKGVRV